VLGNQVNGPRQHTAASTGKTKGGAQQIDKAFIDHLDDEPADALLVGGVIRVAHALGLTVVAEGVERREQLDRLRSLGCDGAQGYLLARPMPAAELTAAIDGAVGTLVDPPRVTGV